jgi:nucleoside-diphosphate-sugar epimerase
MLGPLQWIHAADAARAALLAASAEAARNQVFIVAAEQPATAFDLLVLLWEITCPTEENPFTAAAAAHHLPRPKLDTGKIARALGFRPAIPLRLCLEEALGLAKVVAAPA